MAQKPNIILFITHDQGQHIGCYNTPLNPNSLKTPNIDKLAAEGVRFTNHFCTAPQCSPSRGSIQTSLYPHQNGLIGLVNRGFTLPESSKTLPMYLKESGYTTHLLGFQHESRDVKTLGYDTVSERGFPSKYSCRYMKRDYLKFIIDHKDDDKPFFLNIGTPEVHRPFILYGEPADPNTVIIPPYLPEHKLIRVDMAEFYGSIYTVDDIIGRIMKWLDMAKIRDNTLFIYTTDHGIAFPRAKCSLYDPGIKTALIMNWSKSDLFNNGRIVDSMLNNIDLFPTLLDLIGAEIPKDIEGRSFLPILKNDKKSIRDEIFTEKSFHELYDPMRSIRTEDFKFIRNFIESDVLYQLTPDIPAEKVMKKDVQKRRKMEELYDLKKDPHEMNNLIDNPDYESVVKDLRRRLMKFLEKTNDPILKGHIIPDKYWWDRYLKLEISHKIGYFFLLNKFVPFLMQSKPIRRRINKILGYE